MAWEWADIIADMREAFVVQVAGLPIAIWASKLGSCVQLDGKPYYRVDYLEIDPERRGDGRTSTLLAGMIAKRAAEQRASGIVLTAFPSEKLVSSTNHLALPGVHPGVGTILPSWYPSSSDRTYEDLSMRSKKTQLSASVSSPRRCPHRRRRCSRARTSLLYPRRHSRPLG